MNWGLGIRVTNRQDGTCFDRVFSRFPVRIGRNALNDLVIDDGFVSQFHLVLENHSDRLWLRDLGSTNGTQLAGLGRAPANQLVDLAAHGFEFAIVSLDFRTYTAPLEPAQQEAASRRHRLGVSRYIEVVDPASVVAPPPTAAPSVALGQQHREGIARYRAMWSELLRSIHESLNAMPQAARPASLAQLVRDFPSLAQEPDFERLCREYGVAGPSVPPNASAGGKIESVALQGIREIAQDFCPNLMALDSVDEVVHFLERLQQVLEVFLRSFIPLRDGYRQFETDMALRRPTASGQAPIDAAQNHQDLAKLLLDWRQPAADGPGRIESTLADLMIHQVALLNGVMTGVRSMLFELSPPELERKAEDPHYNSAGMGIGPYRYKSLWKTFEKAHGDLAGEDRQVFSVLFGKQFAQAYEHYFGGGRADATRQAGAPVLSSTPPSDYSMPGNPGGRR